MYLNKPWKLFMFIENFFLNIWNLSCSVFIYGKVFVTITLLQRQYISWKHTMAVHCHGNRFLNASFCVEKQGKYHDLLPILPATFPMGDWNRARASDLVSLSLEQKYWCHFGFLSHFDLFSLATLCQKLNLFLKDERNKNFMGIGLQIEEITTPKEV